MDYLMDRMRRLPFAPGPDGLPRLPFEGPAPVAPRVFVRRGWTDWDYAAARAGAGRPGGRPERITLGRGLCDTGCPETPWFANGLWACLLGAAVVAAVVAACSARRAGE